MALQHLRSSTANKRPTPAGMSDGQLALNTNDASPGLFFKDSNGALVKVGPVHVGTTAPNATPGAGGSSGNSVGEQWLDTSGGTYVFKVWDGSAWRSETGTFVDVNGDVMTGALGIIAGSASTPGLFFSGDANTGVYSPGADQLALSTNGTGRLFVDASGRVSVGTATANRPLVVFNDTVAALSLNNTTTGTAGGDGFQFQLVGSDGFVFNYENAPIIFGTNSTERLRITSAGLVGIGTSSPGAPLNVRFDNAGLTTIALFENQRSVGGSPDAAQIVVGARGYNHTIIRQNSDQGTNAIGGTLDTVIANTYGSPGAKLILATQSTARLTVDASGNVGIGTSTPPQQLSVHSASTTDGRIEAHGIIARDNWGSASGMGNGMFSPASNTLAFSTNSTERCRLDSSGRLGIGTTSPGTYAQLAVFGAVSNFGQNISGIFYNPNGPSSTITIQDNTSASGGGIGSVGNNLVLYSNSGANLAERARIDSSGRLLVGTSTVTTTASTATNNLLALESTNNYSGVSFTANCNDSNGSYLVLKKSRGTSPGSTTVVQSGDEIGNIFFEATDGSVSRSAASIRAFVDGGPGANDMPGRIVLSTTSDGASSPTERMRIDSTGRLFLNTTASPSSSSFGTSIGTVLAHSRDTSTGAVAQIYGSAGEFRIIGSGNAQNTNNSYGAISDQSLKTDISDAGSQWDDIKGITVRKFKLIGTDNLQIGVVAQECELVSPGLVEDTVLEQEDGTTSTVKAVKYSVLYMKAVKALQEAMERIEQLEQRLAAAGI